MSEDESNAVRALFSLLSDLYVGLEDFVEEDSTESLFTVLAILRDLRAAMDTFDRSAVAALRRHEVSWSEITSKLGRTSENIWQRYRLDEGGFGVAQERLASFLEASIPGNETKLSKGAIYTRSDLQRLYRITDATLNNGVFHFKERREIWLFITENKQADREQYVDKLVGDTLYWQGQRLGRTDRLVIDHKQAGETLLVFYRRAKYEFEGAGFRCEGMFEYVSHSGSLPTSFVLQRAAS
jgi:hypothetical protein